MNQELEDYKKSLVPRARTTATVFGILAIIALISLVYAFFKQTEANRARMEAEMNLSVMNKAITELKARLAECESGK